MEILKAKNDSPPAQLAGAIAGNFRINKIVQVQVIGAGAVNQTVKAFILASSFLKEDGYEIILIPEFVDSEINGEIRSAIRFTIEQR